MIVRSKEVHYPFTGNLVTGNLAVSSLRWWTVSIRLKQCRTVVPPLSPRGVVTR